MALSLNADLEGAGFEGNLLFYSVCCCIEHLLKMMALALNADADENYEDYGQDTENNYLG